MARPLRINVENGWYHVFARGLNRMSLFRDDRDREHLLERFEMCAERHRVEVHAYVLMDNLNPMASRSTTIRFGDLSW